MAGEHQAAGPHRALVHAHRAQAADIAVERHLEDMRQDLQRRVGPSVPGLRLGALAVDEVRRVGLQRVGQQPHDDVEQLGHLRAGARGDETHGDQVALAKRML